MTKSLYINSIVMIVFLAVSVFSCDRVQTAEIKSPNGKNVFTLFTESTISKKQGVFFTIINNGNTVFLPSQLELLSEELNLAEDLSIIKVEKSTVEKGWKANFNELSAIPKYYNQLKIFLKSGSSRCNIISRAYNEGIAFV